MAMTEKPRLALQLELSIPDLDGGPPKKFQVTRCLKANWSTNPNEVMNSVHDEVRNYKGSFIGDMIISLTGLVKNRETVNDDSKIRGLEVDRWLSSLLVELIYSGVRDDIYEEKLDSFELDEWDGTVKKIEPVTPDEISSADIERILLLAAPKVKHALDLVGKKMR